MTARRWLLAFALLAHGCVAAGELADHPCPPGGTTLRYTTFGRDFMARWCVHCHGGANGYSSRALNTQEAVQASRARIFVTATTDNPSMPPGPADPPPAERAKLAEWLACGAP